MRAVILLLLTCSLWGADRWRMQYFFDKDREELHLGAIAFCSPTRGVASGYVLSEGRVKPVSIVTSNAGTTWTQVPAPDAGYELFFLEETAGWMVTESGIWFSDECGRSWKRIHKRRGLTGVRFVSREHGWAIGTRKTVIETTDGGKTWQPLKEAQELDTNADYTTFHAIEFVNPKTGIMAAKSRRPQGGRDGPLWLDPEPQKRRERPTLTVSMETHDGGATWSTSKVSMFGRIARIQIAPDGRTLALVQFDDYFDYRSELYRLDISQSQKQRIFRKKDFAGTDILLQGNAYFAGVASMGMVPSPVPQKVRILSSADLSNWSEANVDYRAVATRVMLAGAGGSVWAATDTGMILTRTAE